MRCSPFLHQVAKAAGISDLSAKITRNNNPMNVIKMSLMMLQSGGSPVGGYFTPSPFFYHLKRETHADSFLITGMGDGFGGKGKRLEKGIGMRTGEGGTFLFQNS